MLHKRCDIRDMLDEKIRSYREQRDEAIQGGDFDLITSCVAYIDAYQDIRVAIFDEPLGND